MSTTITPNELPASRMTPEHWARLHTMTEDQILQNALDDPDNLPLNMSNSYTGGNTRSVRIMLEPKIASWLTEHHLDGAKIAASLLSQFVEAQLEDKNAR